MSLSLALYTIMLFMPAHILSIRTVHTKWDSLIDQQSAITNKQACKVGKEARYSTEQTSRDWGWCTEGTKAEKSNCSTKNYQLLDQKQSKSQLREFLIILSSDQEYRLLSTEWPYTPQEIIAGDSQKLYPSFVSWAKTVEEAPADREKWVDIDNWIKQCPICTWSELVDKLDTNDLDSGLLRNYLFETGKQQINSTL